MARYLVEVFQPERVAAKRISQSIQATGSHLSTHAAWRHTDGVAIGTMVVEADDQWRALGIVPPALRSGARISELEPVTTAAAAMAAPLAISAESYAVAA